MVSDLLCTASSQVSSPRSHRPPERETICAATLRFRPDLADKKSCPSPENVRSSYGFSSGSKSGNCPSTRKGPKRSLDHAREFSVSVAQRELSVRTDSDKVSANMLTSLVVDFLNTVADVLRASCFRLPRSGSRLGPLGRGFLRESFSGHLWCISI